MSNAHWASSPEYPEPSAARVAISNSREVSRVSWSGLRPMLFPVTFLKVNPSATMKMEYLDLIPGGRIQVGDDEVCAWRCASANQAPILLSPLPLFKRSKTTFSF